MRLSRSRRCKYQLTAVILLSGEIRTRAQGALTGSFQAVCHPMAGRRARLLKPMMRPGRKPIRLGSSRSSHPLEISAANALRDDPV